MLRQAQHDPICFAGRRRCFLRQHDKFFLISYHHIIRYRVAGAGEDEAGGEVGIGEYVVFGHFDFSAFADGGAGGADAIATAVR